MTRTRQVTATLILATFAAAGCSKSSAETRKAESKEAPPAKVATPAPEPIALKPPDRATLDRAALDAATMPDRKALHYKDGIAAWKTRDLAKAEKEFAAVLEVDEAHLKSLVNLSRVLLEQKRCDEAVTLLTRASGIEPESGEVYRLLGRAHHVQGKVKEAEDAYRHAIDLDDRDPWALNNLGLLLLEQQRADEALPLLEQAVELKADAPAFHNNLGMALEHTGRFKAAAVAYKEALIADSTYERAKQNLARVEAVSKRVEEPASVVR